MKTVIALLLLGSLTVVGGPNCRNAGYVLHEWGTFTTVSGSDGVLLPGLEREEEHLPFFVYSHVGMENGTTSNPEEKLVKGPKVFELPRIPGRRQVLARYKGWNRNLRNVKVKMETPVVYFYADREMEVDMRVGFQGGSISQWYPHRSEGEVPPTIDLAKLAKNTGAIDFSEGYNGWIRWKVDVLPRSSIDPVKLFHEGMTTTWMYPRVSRSAIVRNGLGEYEEYLFYRGVGNFELPMHFSVDDEEGLRVRNDSSHAVPFAFVFENRNGKIRYAVLKDGVAGKSEVAVPEEELTEVSNDRTTPWKEEVYLPLRDGLVATGLYPEEADGMVQTWWKSYFRTEGLRVFWVVPREFTDQILPMQVKPAPRETVRVLVGRSEVLRPRFEKELLAAFTGKTDEDKKRREAFFRDRFGLSYRDRVTALQAMTTVKEER